MVADPEMGGLVCGGCRSTYPLREGVLDCLGESHPTVEREIAAVARLDGGSDADRRSVKALIGDLDDGSLDPDDPRLRDHPGFAQYERAHGRVREMLARRAPAPGAVVIELGADHCLHSSAFLEAGCRVVAVDITDHLHLAPRAGDPALARVRADMNRLPLGDGTADLVWATACAHHSWSLERTFEEARRVLSPDGAFVLVNEPMPAWPRYLAFGLGRRFGRRERALGINETLHRRGRWLDVARKAGFAPRLVVPHLSPAELAAALRRRRLPAALATWIAPVAEALQVSIHMVAEVE